MSFYNHKYPQIDLAKLLKDSILNRATFTKYYREMLGLLSCCSQEKHLIHGDFGFDNLLVYDGKITGVIDWAESRYGDFLYDIAWLDFWSNNIGYAEEFKKYYVENKINIPYFDERIHCYRLHIGLNSLILAAFLKNKEDHHKAEEKLTK